MKLTEDFLRVVMHALGVAAAKQCIVSDSAMDDCVAVAHKIVHSYVHIGHCKETTVHASNDDSFNYAKDLLTMCLVWHGFHDAVQEGDGDRIIMHWKILLPVSNRTGVTIMPKRPLHF